MTSEATKRAEEARPAVSAENRTCPHLLLRNALGSGFVGGLLDYVSARESDFRPADSRRRGSREPAVDQTIRDCLALSDLGDFERPLVRFLTKLAPQAIAALQPAEPALEPAEFEICAYGDGGHFDAHTDTLPRRDHIRILSCVYYFSTTPRRFDGGELRLYPPPAPGADADAPDAVTISPEPDTLVIFPSALRHEVLPVRLRSPRWADRRFTINCWMHRVSG